MPKIGRNAPCPCGSGKKYKKCHGSFAPPIPPEAALMLQRRQAEELIRTSQQGHGRPIVAGQFAEHQFVAVANRLYYSKKWKFFADFLFHYIKEILGREWGAEELAKPYELRHPVFQWAEHLEKFSKKHARELEKSGVDEVVGAVKCYLGLAYNLYLLKHNAELQVRLVKRLRNVQQFQGAYYELVVANCLLRAGFTLELENEANAATKHCEFFAVSRTGKKYWVEAKMRAVCGLLGKTELDGMPPSARPVSKIRDHLRAALAKPTQDARLIFIDVNAPPEPLAEGEFPEWIEPSFGILEAYEKEAPDSDKAYVFVTNIVFHRMLDDHYNGLGALVFGLGMPEFGRPGEYRVSDTWRSKQKHKDIHEITKAIQSYPQVPITFDGSIPLDEETERERVKIGERYMFSDGKGGSRLGKVTTAIMSDDKELILGVSHEDATSTIYKRPASEEEFRAYKAYPDAYFGVVQRAGRKTNDPYELFEWLVETQTSMPTETILKHCERRPDIEDLRKLSHEDLVLAYCEGLVAAIASKQKETN